MAAKKKTARKPVAKKKAAKKPARKPVAKRPVRARAAVKKRAPAKRAPAKRAPAKRAPKRPAPAKRATESLELRTVLPVSPERALSAWLDSAEHSAFTGSDATIDAKVGGKHSAWNGYIEGELLEIQPGKRIVMSWRTTEFDPKQPDSILVVEASPHEAGTELRVVHTELPPGGAEKYGKGWTEFYFAPMETYFRRLASAN